MGWPSRADPVERCPEAVPGNARGQRTSQPWRAHLVHPRQEDARDGVGRPPRRRETRADLRGTARGATGARRRRARPLLRSRLRGHRGWIGVRLDRKVDWQEIEQILVDAYTCVGPAKLVAELQTARLDGRDASEELDDRVGQRAGDGTEVVARDHDRDRARDLVGQRPGADRRAGRRRRRRRVSAPGSPRRHREFPRPRRAAPPRARRDRCRCVPRSVGRRGRHPAGAAAHAPASASAVRARASSARPRRPPTPPSTSDRARGSPPPTSRDDTIAPIE